MDTPQGLLGSIYNAQGNAGNWKPLYQFATHANWTPNQTSDYVNQNFKGANATADSVNNYIKQQGWNPLASNNSGGFNGGIDDAGSNSGNPINVNHAPENAGGNPANFNATSGLSNLFPDMSSFNNALNDWWKTIQTTNQSASQQTQPASDLSTLYPRVNWGNYQSNDRGSRYFNNSNGTYQQPQQMSL